jgi:hypothetical protein
LLVTLLPRLPGALVRVLNERKRLFRRKRVHPPQLKKVLEVPDMTQEEKAGWSVSRAEEALERAGQNFGFFAIRSRQRVQQTLASLRNSRGRQEASSQTEGAPVPSSQGQTEEAASATMKRAEDLIDRVGGTAGLLATVVGLRLRRATARMREEAEDMWAEAQSLRSHQRDEDKKQKS